MALLYYGFPKLPLTGGKMEMAFSIGWVCFAIIAIGGNLAEFLYQPSSKKKATNIQVSSTKKIERQRMY